MNSGPTLNEKDANLGRQIINTYLPYWPLFTGLVLLSVLAATLYLKYTTPVYEATARVMIKDEKKGVERSKAIEAFDMLDSKKIIENEIEVIRSRSLLWQVVQKLHLYAPVHEEQRFRNAAAFLSSPIEIEARNPKSLKETKRVNFSFNAQKAVVSMNGRDYPMNQWVETAYGSLRFIRNNNYVQAPEGQLYFSLQSPRQVVSNLDNNLEAAPTNKMSSIIKLDFRDEVPQRAENILNELMLAYNNAMDSDRTMLAENTLSFLDDRLARVEHELDSVEKRIQKYKANRGAIDIGTEGRLFLENVSSNDQRLSEINMQLAVLGQVENYVRSKDNNGGLVPSTLGVTDPVLSQLVNKLYLSELERESMRRTTAENNPLLASVTDQIEKMKPGILENVQNQRKSLMASKANLSATNSAYSSMIQSIPEKERTLIDINREQSIKSELYTFLLQKREEAALSSASTVSDTRLIDKAEASEQPISPKKKVIYLAGMLIALVLGICLVHVKESFSTKIMFRRQIEKLTTIPVIGEIPFEASKELFVTSEYKRTFTAEQFRRLRMTLPYANMNSMRKRILVTSSISGEGKSFVAANLAVTLAITGKKVVLVDLDLNNPSLSKQKFEAASGVSEYLQGTEDNIQNIIAPSKLHKNLSVIPTGSLPLSPSELIMNGKIPELLDQLDAMFDYIVIDTAPVVPVTDAYLISKYCDGTLYVVRHGYTPAVLVERLDESNKIHPLTNLVIVFNGVTARGFGNKNYGYGYGYGYIYRDTPVRKQLPVV